MVMNNYRAYTSRDTPVYTHMNNMCPLPYRQFSMHQVYAPKLT